MKTVFRLNVFWYFLENAGIPIFVLSGIILAILLAVNSDIIGGIITDKTWKEFARFFSWSVGLAFSAYFIWVLNLCLNIKLEISDSEIYFTNITSGQEVSVKKDSIVKIILRKNRPALNEALGDLNRLKKEFNNSGWRKYYEVLYSWRYRYIAPFNMWLRSNDSREEREKVLKDRTGDPHYRPDFGREWLEVNTKSEKKIIPIDKFDFRTRSSIVNKLSKESLIH